ncbi:reverse transcriptase [Corchorus olitorius]|uniref:Reverse transcriptase n=1 Tax=Corchorus olitorius TaxID=93759 RepID=A0A1R3HBJ4_9ROSI|nr:reverse transcriptase [Corchorus olitorius]
MLHNSSSDEWVSDQDDLKQLVVAYYKDLFYVEEGEVRPLDPLPQPVISFDEKLSLQKGISPTDVRCALFQMKPWKAPGLMVSKLVCTRYIGMLLSVSCKEWKPITIGRGGPSISHLFFVDDLFLFGRASARQAETIRGVLDCFCLASGAKVSLEKSRMYITPKASGGNARLVSSILGIGTTNDLGKYLGIPLVHKKVGGALYRELINKVNTRLSGWKSKVLNIAGVQL